MKKNIQELEIKDCFGCLVCAKACPCNIISGKTDDNGFFQPYITQPEKCIHCGLCAEVCSFHNDGIAQSNNPMASYAGWSRDNGTRKRCSSGGVGYEIAKTVINEGGRCCSVRYNPDKKIAEHYIANSVSELDSSIGSKYIQSYTLDGFTEIDPKKRYIVFGTPCQIDSFRRYVTKINKSSNFILVDFFCHGVPSYLLWWKYLELQEKDLGKITSAVWRDKRDGWHDSWTISLKGTSGRLFSKLSDKNLFYRTFLSDSCLGKACYDNCKFKYKSSSADIRIGDAWGRLYSKDNDGVSVVICYTPQGAELLGRSNIQLNGHDFSQVAEYQMKKNAARPFISRAVWKILKSKGALNAKMLSCLMSIHEWSLLPGRVFNKLKKVIK